jgi:hypothetical protein
MRVEDITSVHTKRYDVVKSEWKGKCQLLYETFSIFIQEDEKIGIYLYTYMRAAAAQSV